VIMLLLLRRGLLVAPVFILGLLVVSCGGEEVAEAPTATPEASATPQPSPEEEAVTTPETAIATETAVLVEPTPQAADEYEGWLTYTNDRFGYEFRYPPEAMVTEAEEAEFAIPLEEAEAGITFDELYERYTGKICVTVWYELGYVSISAPENAYSRYVICQRTSRAYEGPRREEVLLIEGKTYTADGFEEQGPGETLPYHNETLYVQLEDGTRINYGSWSVETATFEDYLQIRDELVKIVQSYRKIP
jgi:hypothetical protein